MLLKIISINARTLFFKCKHPVLRLHSPSQAAPNVIENLLNKPTVVKYLKQYVEKDSELKIEYPKIASLLERRSHFENELRLLESLEKDKDLKELVTEERNTLDFRIQKINKEILALLVPTTKLRNDEVVLEVSAGVGGKEAMFFAKELWNMYANFALEKNWLWFEEENELEDLGGLRKGVVRISGPEVTRILVNEAGVHRVQRIPATEKSGRVHTSTATVAVLFIPDSISIEINPADIRMETKTSSGAGGQHVNKTESCVRLIHIPTGIVIENQTDRSQIRNKKLAMERLKEKLYQIEAKSIQHNSQVSRKLQVGDSERSEKIRTYNFPQDRITDHRLGVTVHNIEMFFKAGNNFKNLLEQLSDWRIQKDIIQLVESRLHKLKEMVI